MDPSQNPTVFHATTIVCVRRGEHVAIAGDGQVTLGHTVMKGNARKVRRLGRDSQVLAGFAGAAADAFTLFELFEAKLEKHGQLQRAAVELAKDWRTERRLGKLVGFRQGLERAFPVPQDWAAYAPDDLVICRCENVTAGTLRQTVATAGADELNRLKALSRVGMGRCQGRMCGVAAAEILAHATQQPLQQVGRLRGQAPIKPIPIRLVPAEEGAGA